MTTDTKKILIWALGLSALISAGQLSLRTITQITAPQGMPLHSLSAQFTGLKAVFANVPRAGYYSDKDMERPLNIAQFELAQYVLAPTVFELNNASLPWVVFDCTSPQVALDKIKELRLTPVSASNSGIILASNPNYRP